MKRWTLLFLDKMRTDPKNKAGEEFNKFREFAQKIVSVPKSEIDRREAEYQKGKKEKRKGRKS